MTNVTLYRFATPLERDECYQKLIKEGRRQVTWGWDEAPILPYWVEVFHNGHTPWSPEEDWMIHPEPEGGKS